METITKYKSVDGIEFSDEAACAKYEATKAIIDGVMALLPAKPDLPGCEFENGAGFIQHDRETFTKVRRRLLEIANAEFPHKWFEQSMADDNANASWAARLIGEGNNRALDRAWHRIYCTDAELREWGQPYYAMHPNDAKQVCLAKA